MGSSTTVLLNYRTSATWMSVGGSLPFTGGLSCAKGAAAAAVAATGVDDATSGSADEELCNKLDSTMIRELRAPFIKYCFIRSNKRRIPDPATFQLSDEAETQISCDFRVVIRAKQTCFVIFFYTKQSPALR